MHGNRGEFADRTLRSVEVQRIDEDAGVGLPGSRDNPAGRRKIGDKGPGPEFEISRQSVLGCGLAKSCEAIRKAIQIGIVSRDQNMFGAEPRTGFEKCGERGNVGFRPECDDFQICNGDAGRIQSGECLLQARFVVHQRIGKPSRYGRKQPDSDMVVAASGSDLDQLGRRELKNGQRGQREFRHYSKSAMRASSANMP